MEWTPKMRVGLAELDDDHKELVRIINQLGSDYKDEDRRRAVRQSLVALRRYAEFHFAREEQVLMACAYTQLEGHQGEHRDFVQRIQELTRQFDSGPDGMAAIVNEELMDFLRDWLTHHIMIVDMAYRETIENNPAAKDAAKNFQGSQVWWSG